MSLAFDESGRPFIILREQSKKKRVKGLEAHKVSNIQRDGFYNFKQKYSLFRYRLIF
jgi:predicted restriction endonuclease